MASSTRAAGDSRPVPHLAPLDDIWAPDLSRRGTAALRDAIARDTEEMLRDWRAARAALRA